MKERPILFSGPMVRAILAGQKTQTRRLVRPQGTRVWTKTYPSGLVGWETDVRHEHGPTTGLPYRPHGAVGDRLWVRETWRRVDDEIRFRAGCAELPGETWKPGIHLRRVDARITLEISAVRVERLNDISEDDATAEGVDAMDGHLGDVRLCARAKAMGLTTDESRVWFAELWDQINGDRSPWTSNPWVWVISFRRIAP